MISKEQWDRLKPGSVIRYTPVDEFTGEMDITDIVTVIILKKTTYQIKDIYYSVGDPDWDDSVDFDTSRYLRKEFSWYKKNHTVIVE